MPDLTILYARFCSTNQYWEAPVAGSRGAKYTVRFERRPYPHPVQYDYTCTCDAFKYGKGKTCKHIVSVKHERCGWNGELEPSAEANPDGTCPCCGGPTDVLPVGV